MHKTQRQLSVRLILLAAIAGSYILISASAAAAEGPGGSSKSSFDRTLNFQTPDAVIDLKVRDGSGGSTAIKVGPRKGEIFRATTLPAGVEAGASNWPDLKLFADLNASDSSPEAGDKGAPAPAPGGNPPPAQERPSTVASTVPMTAGEKFELFASKSFKPPAPYALSILSGVWDEAIDSKHKKPHRSAGDFAADSLTHAARSYAFRVTSNFFEKFAYASLFKQDPRYHHSPYTGFGSRLKYAVTRVFVTQGDNNGKNEFNVSFLFGGLTAATISNVWEPTRNQNGADTLI